MSGTLVFTSDERSNKCRREEIHCRSVRTTVLLPFFVVFFPSRRKKKIIVEIIPDRYIFLFRLTSLSYDVKVVSAIVEMGYHNDRMSDDIINNNKPNLSPSKLD